MRWTTDLEELVSTRLAEGTCPLCGGRVKVRATYLGRQMSYLLPYCVNCGAEFRDDDGYDHPDI